ncbi:MAG: peptidase S8 family protein [Alphaproteobacteria bacterium HGW-Alphaproteobacteria-5]|nr:MAG: peptidase S8 family protein [Alphaproteobacteria bacterium HGW-Alphaproteobacteria-5]
MPEFVLPHVDMSNRRQASDYKAPPRNLGGGRAPRIREEHGAILLAQLRAAFQEVVDTPSPDPRFERSDGAYYEVELRKGSDAEALDKSRKGILAGAAKRDAETEAMTAVLFVPDESLPVLENILEDYRAGPLTAKGKPRHKSYVEPIEAIRRARLLSFWTDKPAALPADPQAEIWWEVWCMRGFEGEVLNALERLDCQVADEDYHLTFPEMVVVPIFARRADVEVVLFACKGITELRRGSDTPSFFVDDERENQHDWAGDLSGRTVWPGADAPRVCLLDTGVNRAHVLIEPALAEEDLLTANPDWVPSDNQAESHGTEMAGLALHGDLFAALQDQSERLLRHRLESVRIMPADGFPPNEPARLGTIMSTAVALAEIQNPDADRVFCMAITNEDVSGERGTSWSASVDRTAVGKREGDDPNAPRRLFFVSAGNVPPVMNFADLQPPRSYPIEDPAQAWNALTVGGYTEKQIINDDGLDGYRPMSPMGDLSPFSRNSLAWVQGKTPVKPEIVMEAGNRAQSADGQSLVSCPSLELLTTGSEVDRLPIVNFAATSAATALASRLAARLQADHPDYWPETIRALMVHSAQWTDPMWRRLRAMQSLRDKQRLARCFGYGVPSYERATASAREHLALVAQQTIQPYKKKVSIKDGVKQYSVGFNECHYYALPWPKALLEEYADNDFILKVTLSYFVEPNPGRAAAIDPQKYQSFGLRFDLKRSEESEARFRAGINAEETLPADRAAATRPSDSGWEFGPSNVSAGSIHCDQWKGSGARLASRDLICVKPVSGWWKERSKAEVCEQKARYALVVTLASPEVDIDLYTPISTEIAPPITVETDIFS